MTVGQRQRHRRQGQRTPRVTDVPPLSADFTFFGGLYRDVHVLVTDPVHIDALDFGSPGVYVKTTNVSAASREAPDDRRASRNAIRHAATATVRAVVVDAATERSSARSDQRRSASAGRRRFQRRGRARPFPNPHLWNGLTDPYLYHGLRRGPRRGPTSPTGCAQPLGFRYFTVDADATAFTLNGQYLGPARREPAPGSA